MPWYLALVPSSLPAVGNVFVNGGRFSRASLAAVTGSATAGANQVPVLVVGLPTLAANTIFATVRGIFGIICAVRDGHLQQVVSLLATIGALLLGIQVYFGILQEWGRGSGLPCFGQSALIMLGVGVDVGIGSFLHEAVRLCELQVVRGEVRVVRRGGECA